MNDFDERKIYPEDRPWRQWTDFITFVVFLAGIVFLTLKFAAMASSFVSLWMSIPSFILVGLALGGELFMVVFLLHRKHRTGRFKPTHDERKRKCEETLRKMEAGEPLHSRTWYLITPVIVLAVLLCTVVSATAWMSSGLFRRSLFHDPFVFWIPAAIVFVNFVVLMYKPMMRGLRPRGHRLSEKEINKIHERLRNPLPQRKRILAANLASIAAGIFTSMLFTERPPNALFWAAAVCTWIMAVLLMWQVFRPFRPLLPLQDVPEEAQRNPVISLKLTALGVVLPLALASIFPLFITYLAAHPVRRIYPAPQQAKADTAAALSLASQSHKRVLLDFGVNWCADCKTLNRYFLEAKNQAIVESNFVHVRINTDAGNGRDCATANQELANQVGIPLDKGVPALAVLSDKGELIYSQRNGEFEDMRHLKSSDLTEFLLRWKP